MQGAFYSVGIMFDIETFMIFSGYNAKINVLVFQNTYITAEVFINCF